MTLVSGPGFFRSGCLKALLKAQGSLHQPQYPLLQSVSTCLTYNFDSFSRLSRPTRGAKSTSTAMLLAAIALLLTQHAWSANAQTEESPEDQLRYTLGKIPLFPNSTRIRVCASPWTPAVECTIDGTKPSREQWAAASGYEIEVFKQMMPVLGWTDEMIDFKCLGWTEMMDELAANETGCDVAPSGIAPTLEWMEEGISFSDATIQSGLAVMMVSQDSMTRWVARFTLSSQLSAITHAPLAPSPSRPPGASGTSSPR